MTSPKTILFAGVAVLLALVACDEATGGMAVGAPYELRTINEQPLPIPAPGATGEPARLPVIIEGSVTFSSDGTVERHERTVTSTATTEWTQTGTYSQQLGRVVIRYNSWPPAQGGPLTAAETLLATKGGGLTLTQADAVRHYCLGATAC